MASVGVVDEVIRGAWCSMVYKNPYWADMRSYIWYFKMDSSSVWGMPMDTFLDMGSSKDLINQSGRNFGSTSILQMKHRLCHSWIWLSMWVVVDWWSLVRSFNPISCWIGSWENERKSLVIPSNVSYVPIGLLTYHLEVSPIRVHWNNRNWIKPSIMLFEEH